MQLAGDVLAGAPLAGHVEETTSTTSRGKPMGFPRTVLYAADYWQHVLRNPAGVGKGPPRRR